MASCCLALAALDPHKPTLPGYDCVVLVEVKAERASVLFRRPGARALPALFF
jgi:hypothetical protein